MKAIFRPGRARVMRTNELLLASSVICCQRTCSGTGAGRAARRREVIVVTGSRIARDVTDASTPLAIIGAEEIKLSGATTIDKVLNDQPQFVAATNGGATANQVPAGSAAGAAYVNLRGFGPTRSLTLVNGRRFAIFGPEQVTDLNTIPTALIERTEVVTGGSSAVYGSDAITGVVNFIMKDDFEGVKVGGQYGFDSCHQHADLQRRSHAGRQFRRRPRQRGGLAELLQARRLHARRARRLGGAALRRRPASPQNTWSDSLIGVANGRPPPTARHPAAGWVSSSPAAATFPTGVSR